MTNKIVIVSSSDSDWAGLFVNDSLKHEGHSISEHELLSKLYKFLLSKVGQDWSETHSEAVSRLDQEEPIFRIVSILEENRKDYFYASDFNHFSGLYVDENDILQKVSSNLTINDVTVYCSCCTYTLNGIRVPKKKNAKKNYFLLTTK